MKTATECVNLPATGDPHDAIAPPIYQTATFRQPGATEFGEYDYSRSANPTRSLVEAQIARLERGTRALAFSSGMAAISAVTRLVRCGESIVAGDDLYGGTCRLLGRITTGLGIEVRHVDTTSPEALTRAIDGSTRLVLLETPTNPLLRISDIQEIAGIAHDAGALLAIDNSLLSPVLQRPLELGADIVIHSATKFLCGHSDVTAGAVVVKAEALGERIAFVQNAEGAGLAPFDAWLLLRGMKTLALRVERQCVSAQRIAEYLDAHPLVTKVHYPGLVSHPGHALQCRQTRGAGGVISFETGDPERSRQIVEGARLFAIAVSFGGVGSVISLPARMSHASIPAELRDRIAPADDLVRISVGIEDVEDLIEDLAQALETSDVVGLREGVG